MKYVQAIIESTLQQLTSLGATSDVQLELGKLFDALGNSDGVDANTVVVPTVRKHFRSIFI